ncbi:helix-turn-helix domain-containing protein [Amnibacterium sp.]|uniref:helix-turn-helix domain-containing protein n=1 Tax=Amnibacterium sp. TaxID=1872496 RepID=UPI003F7C599E
MFEIGNSLREVRERQGLGYPEIELATKIRAKYIRALEEEDFDSVPGDAYVRGFLRTYAEYLGLDGDVYVDEYASRFLADWREEPRERPERPRVRRRERRFERRAVLLVLAGIALVTALVFAAWRYGGGTGAQPPTVGTQQRHQHPASARQLVLHGVGPGTYVEVRRRSGDNVVLQGTVGAGETYRLAGSRFYLLVRRPAGLRATLRGRAVALPAATNLRVLVTPQRTTRLHG